MKRPLLLLLTLFCSLLLASASKLPRQDANTILQKSDKQFIIENSGNSIAIDVIGNANVTGQTNSPDFDITANAFQTTYGGGSEFGKDVSITINSLSSTSNNTITLSSAPGTDNQTKCINTAITTITYNTTGATGATFTGLPAGVTGTFASNKVTISGTPTTAGTFNYTVNLTGGSGTVKATGKITVITKNTITLSSAGGNNIQTICGMAIPAITYNTAGATGAIFAGLPAGVNGNFVAGIITISGIPNVTGTFNYTITLTGGCGTTTTTTGTINVTSNKSITLSSAAGTNIQTRCISTAITNITYNTIGAAGATFTGLPAGVIGNFMAGIVTISGTPTVAGTFNYTVTLMGGCGVTTANGTITVTPKNTIALSSAGGTNNQTTCIGSAITNIYYNTVGATGATFTGLPTGVTGTYASNKVVISGTPFFVSSGTYNYAVTLTGGCGVTTANGTITLKPRNTITLSSAAGTNIQTKCISTAITTITYNTVGATGATFTGLPTGVTGTYASNKVTISGTPTVAGTFNYTVTLTGGCGVTTATGTIAATPKNTITLSSAAGTNFQTKCISTAITTITYNTVGATGATFIGLPTGVVGSYASNKVLISGTPIFASAGTYNYTVTLTGGCGVTTATGTITLTPRNTITLSSAAGTNIQTKCINTAITTITYNTVGATGATFTGLPTGVTGTYASNKVYISGTPTVAGTFNYTVTLTGGCGVTTATGTITTSKNTITLSSAVGTNNQTTCIGSAITSISYNTVGATGATFTGLPTGVVGSYASNKVLISGTPLFASAGTYNYTVTLTGGCGVTTATGTITIPPKNTITLSSAAGTINQTTKINTAITNITYNTVGATGATFNGLPTGVSGTFASNKVTISGKPTVTGTFNYTVTLTGGCGVTTATGKITVSVNFAGDPVIETESVKEPESQQADPISNANWSFYPNPNFGQFTLQRLNGGTFELLDISGKVINTYIFEEDSYTVTEYLTKGIYFIREKESNTVQKIIIQ